MPKIEEPSRLLGGPDDGFCRAKKIMPNTIHESTTIVKLAAGQKCTLTATWAYAVNR